MAAEQNGTPNAKKPLPGPSGGGSETLSTTSPTTLSESTENRSFLLRSNLRDLTGKGLAEQIAYLVAESIRTGIIPVTGGKRILDGVVVEHSESLSGKEQMVELEDVLSGEGNERRVDNHLLVLYLGQMNRQIQELSGRLSAHMGAEEDHQSKIAELIELLMTFKGILRILKWVSAVAAGIGVIIAFFKDHVK